MNKVVQSEAETAVNLKRLGRAARAAAPDCTATPMAAMDWAPRLKNWRRVGLGWQSPGEQPQSGEAFVLDFDISLIRVSVQIGKDGANGKSVTPQNLTSAKHPTIRPDTQQLTIEQVRCGIGPPRVPDT